MPVGDGVQVVAVTFIGPVSVVEDAVIVPPNWPVHVGFSGSPPAGTFIV
jgi:hypothetical protein